MAISNRVFRSNGKVPIFLKTNTAENSPTQDDKIDCGGACDERCKLSSRPNLCKRACGTCCDRCNCVPPGTSGNYDSCPCYRDLTTHGGQHKCP
ncbi:hypothetical protein REPUB_Repub02eG0019800 [Reevesia pubescens]